MVDISMCQDKACPHYHACYRAQARPHPTWQTWFASSPRPEGSDDCEYFIPIRNRPTKGTPTNAATLPE